MTKKELMEFLESIKDKHDDTDIFAYVKPWNVNSEYYTENFKLFDGFGDIPSD